MTPAPRPAAQVEPPPRQARRAHPGRLAALLAALAVSGCDPVPVPAPPPPVVVPAPVAESAKVAALRGYYAEVQRTLLAQGMMRTDSGASDAPWGARQLAANFQRIALYDELQSTDEGFVPRETESRLRRWSGPVRVSLIFGNSYPPARRAVERARVASFLARLQRITGHPISLVDGPGNFTVAFVNEDERAGLRTAIGTAMPSFTASEVNAFLAMPQDTYCQVSANARFVGQTYFSAFAVIRSELPDLLAVQCLHEELAQGLGLPNDSPAARPSVFNDNQEFALLTPMDEALLAMLYDPRLRPGMTPAEAWPVVQLLASAYAPGET